MSRDRLGRPLRSVRLSVTDRCNLRCAYCMPEESYRWLDRADLLTFEELSQVADALVRLGVAKVRLTGGEPLVRRDLHSLVGMLTRKPLEEVAMTTNGVLLEDAAPSLREAGLTNVTVSLDTLSAKTFSSLTRRDSLGQVLRGIEAAKRAGFALKLDMVVMRGVNDHELDAMLSFAREASAELRFIEYMDVGGATRWTRDQVVPANELLERLGQVEALPGRGSAPAQRYRLPSGQTFGLIASTTRPFCASCDRARVTADGQLLTCLYATQGLDLRTLLRSQGPYALEQALDARWQLRHDRGAEERLALRDRRGPFAAVGQLQQDPHLEMHTRGG